MTDLIIVGQQALTPEEYAVHRRKRERENQRRRERYANDPEYRARKLAVTKQWRMTHPHYLEAERERRNTRMRERYANDPDYRARKNATARKWQRQNRERWRTYNREWMRAKRAATREVIKVGSLHDGACKGPTRATGCRCRKLMVYERVEGGRMDRPTTRESA